MSEKIILFDSTLRDGAQAEGISFSVEDKIRVLETLDRVGIDIIEAGNPGSNPKDIEFFERVKDIELKHSKLCAFGSCLLYTSDAADDAALMWKMMQTCRRLSRRIHRRLLFLEKRGLFISQRLLKRHWTKILRWLRIRWLF